MTGVSITDDTDEFLRDLRRGRTRAKNATTHHAAN
jgi:hypothetical protein